MFERETRMMLSALSMALLTVVGMAGCGKSSADEVSLGLQSTSARTMDIVSTVAATGTIEPIRVIDVKSQASGEVRTVAVELGDKVKRGALLVAIDPRDVRNAYAQAEADLGVAKARTRISKRQLARTSALRDSAVVTQDELESAILEQANAHAALVKATTNVELARDRLNDVVVRAPIDGTIVEKNVEEGQIVTSTREVTGGTVLMRMADLAEVQVRTLVDETDIGHVRPGLTASIRVEAYPDREFSGKVLKIEPQAVVEQNVTLFAVLTRISNENDLLRPGMNADVEIVVGKREGVLALPNGAIKTPAEARQLVDALGLDPAPLAAGDGGGDGVRRAGGFRGGASGSAGHDSADVHPVAGKADRAAGTPAGSATGVPSMSRIQQMSQSERRRLMERLTPAQRRQMFASFRAAHEKQQRRDRANPARPKPAFVFVQEPEDAGGLSIKPITIGLSNWEYTEVLSGLKGGEAVVEVPLSLIQQREFLERIRGFSQVPGISRSGQSSRGKRR